ncbi:MAG: HEPN domain-containing protein [Planctomycetota bacterium]
MDKKRAIKYWLKSSGNDWQVANHLFQKRDYSYALFFGHLTIEKILKALYIDRHVSVPPYTHTLKYLVEKIPLQITDTQKKLLETITDFNIEARYSDYKFTFWKRCTKEYTKKIPIRN